eukprot:3457004-Rhodomonas_salina.3
MGAQASSHGEVAEPAQGTAESARVCVTVCSGRSAEQRIASVSRAEQIRRVQSRAAQRMRRAEQRSGEERRAEARRGEARRGEGACRLYSTLPRSTLASMSSGLSAAHTPRTQSRLSPRMCLLEASGSSE